jgi:NAD(P)-dependent dehydrogenase (short-subunit alcohol dehydrogenase family)
MISDRTLSVPEMTDALSKVMHPLKDKVVLVTGGSSGIGRATALRLAGHGCKIAVAARNQAALEEVAHSAAALGATAISVPTDVTVAEQCREAVERSVAKFGRLDILVCCAGLSMRAYFEGSDLQAMERVMHVNFFGTLYTTYFALPYVKQSRGSLVALSSLTGLRGVPSYGLYGASKFAIQGLYDSLRLELWRDGVHVGVVAPGFVDTPLRGNVLGPDGKPWDRPPPPPFRIWPVEKCVDKIVKLILQRRRQTNLPWFMGPLYWLDEIVLRWIGDRILTYMFPPLDDYGVSYAKADPAERIPPPAP